MDISLIFNGDVTPFELLELHEKKGYEFVIEDGQVTEIV